MSISVVCSECETRLSVQDDLLGRRMKCPICGEVFTVTLADAPAAAPDEVPAAPHIDKPAKSRTDERAPNYQTGTLEEFVQVLPAEQPEVEAAREIVWSDDVLPEPPAPPQEVVWSEEANEEPVEAPPPPSPKEVFWSAADIVPDFAPAPVIPSPPIPRADDRYRPRPKRGRLAMLIVLVLALLGGMGAGGVLLKRYLDAEPDRLFAKAQQEYAAKNYEPARKLYTEFAEKNPNDPRATEARFFSELCALRSAVYSVSVRTDPTAAVQQFEKFLKFAETPTYQSFLEEGKYKVDVWECALKLTEEVIGRAGDKFNRDQPGDSDTLLAKADVLGKVVDRFRPKDLPKENVFSQVASFRQQVADAKERLVFLAEVKGRLAAADDAAMLAVRSDIQSRGFEGDAGFQKALAEADKRMAEQVAYKRVDPPIEPTREKAAASTALLFAPRLDKGARKLTSEPGTVFFALARGILYALDENDGHVLWAARTGIDCEILPLLIPASDLHPELAIVVGQEGDKAYVSACLARTGETYWRQELPAAAVGRPLQVGNRLYISLRDRPEEKAGQRVEKGVIAEIDLTSGSQMGRIVLGRPHASPGVRRPGTGQVFFPAEARGIYVFDMERVGPDGSRLDATYLGMLATEHPAGGVRGSPVLTAPDGDSAGYLILSLADGLDATSLRAYPLPPVEQTPTLPAAPPPALGIRGWPTFAPYCDAEKLVLVTDRGELGLFGIRQAWNVDQSIFRLPPEPLSTPANAAARGQVVYANEESVWYLAGGSLRQMKTGFDFEQGLRIAPHGKPTPLGEPLHEAQVNARKTAAMVVTQASAGTTCRATAIDLNTGTNRWQRQLGLIPADTPARIGDRVVLMDQSGGIYSIDATSLANAGSTEWLVDDRWLAAPPLNNVTGKAHFLSAADGESVYGVLNVGSEKGSRIVVRHFVPGSQVHDYSAALPAAVAGRPVVVGNFAVLPLANGLLYRLKLEQGSQLESGPTWRAERVGENAVCHLCPLGEDEFIASDGSKGISRWRWPPGEEAFRRLGSANLSEKVAAIQPQTKDGNRFLVADAKGNVTLWDAGRFNSNASPQQSWKPGEANPLTDRANRRPMEITLDKGTALVPRPDGTILLRKADAEGAKVPDLLMNALPPLGWLFPATPR